MNSKNRMVKILKHFTLEDKQKQEFNFLSAIAYETFQTESNFLSEK